MDLINFKWVESGDMLTKKVGTPPAGSIRDLVGASQNTLCIVGDFCLEAALGAAFGEPPSLSERHFSPREATIF